MYKHFEANEVVVANHSGAMGAETISKNGHSSKSQMSRGNFFRIYMKKYFLILSVMICFAFSAYSQMVQSWAHGTWVYEEGNQIHTVTISATNLNYSSRSSSSSWAPSSSWTFIGINEGVLWFQIREGNSTHEIGVRKTSSTSRIDVFRNGNWKNYQLQKN